jgi:predicted pyridoxine 5'-phosphate oxidase superfamily flavin-nucleotide-binding protein
MTKSALKFTSDIAFSPSVKKIQQELNSRSSYARMEESGGWQKEISGPLEDFIKASDSFYLSTSNSLGQPYTQHRGGPKGFLKVRNPNTLAFADFSGNKQFITLGNLNENNKAFIFMMDYENQTRIKIWGTAKVDTDDQELIKSLTDQTYKARIERAIVFTVEAWDVNCRQHIKKRYTKEYIQRMTQPLENRIKELEARVKLLL